MSAITQSWRGRDASSAARSQDLTHSESDHYCSENGLGLWGTKVALGRTPQPPTWSYCRKVAMGSGGQVKVNGHAFGAVRETIP